MLLELPYKEVVSSDARARARARPKPDAALPACRGFFLRGNQMQSDSEAILIFKDVARTGLTTDVPPAC